MNASFQYGTLATRVYFVDRLEDRVKLKNYLSSYINDPICGCGLRGSVNRTYVITNI